MTTIDCNKNIMIDMGAVSHHLPLYYPIEIERYIFSTQVLMPTQRSFVLILFNTRAKRASRLGSGYKVHWILVRLHTKWLTTFLCVVGLELIQKYLGDGPKLVHELFWMVEEHAPSIIFIDDIDAIGTKQYIPFPSFVLRYLIIFILVMIQHQVKNMNNAGTS